MLMTEYPLRYWQERGVYTSLNREEAFMEFKLFQLLGAGNSALMMMILAQERDGRDMGACRAELVALQQIACMSGVGGVLVLTDRLLPRRRDGSQNRVSGSSGGSAWIFDMAIGQWRRTVGGR